MKNASWDALNDDLFSLNLFVYEGSESFSSADVVAGYDAVRDGISAVFGPSPDERTDRHGNRSAVWRVQGTVIELYAHVSVAPAVQVGAAHEGRTAVYHQLIAVTETPEALNKHVRRSNLGPEMKRTARGALLLHPLTDSPWSLSPSEIRCHDSDYASVMEHSRVALPEPSYLARIGEIAYTMSSMEWTILGDIHRLEADLPEALLLDQLEPEMTSGIAAKIKAATTVRSA